MVQTRRRDALKLLGGATLALTNPARAATAARAGGRPNFIIIVADDLGAGDLGCNGSSLIATPNIDRMARQGLRMTDFYASANVCTPSRAGLLTGQYPIRTGLGHEVIQVRDTNGLSPDAITIGKALQPAYATALIGKWHLGHHAPHWPPAVHGFDRYFGIPYSNDMNPLPLYSSGSGTDLITLPLDQTKLTEQFFDETLRFAEQQRDRPFVVLLMLSAPHIPLRPAKAGRSQAGAYGDVVEEIDAHVAGLFQGLERLGLDRSTLVAFTSDNGPWFEGSAGPARAGKGAAGWDGGYRVPMIVRHPGSIRANTSSDAIAMNFDLLPTLTTLAGLPTPIGLDGRDLTPVWQRGAPSPHEQLVLFDNERVAAIRTQRWKLVGRSYYRRYSLPLAALGLPLLFDMARDPGEHYSLAVNEPKVLADLQARFKAARDRFEPLGRRQVPDQLPSI
jgi:arylsulfatase A